MCIRDRTLALEATYKPYPLSVWEKPYSSPHHIFFIIPHNLHVAQPFYPKYSFISAFFISSNFSRLCCSLPPSRLTPCHLPLGGRLFFGPETFPLRQKAPSQRELSPKVTEGVTQNIPASAPFSSVPAFQGSAVRSASACRLVPQNRKIRVDN